MSNQTIRLDDKKAHLVCDEVLQKISNYEARMSPRLARWVEIAELWNGKTSTGRENAKTVPNSTELYKAVRAISNMQYRMLTGQKPWFELEPLDIIGYSDPHKLLKTEHYITNQLDLSRFNKGLYRALVQLNLYGSVAVHEQYEPLRASFLGKKRYITSFRPVSLVNCAFSLDAYDIEESGWVALSDIQSKTELEKLVAHDPEGKIYNHKAIKAAQAEQDYAPRVNNWVTQRMAWQGYVNANFTGGMERVTYYGPLSCMNSEEEYCVEIVNRQFIVRMESYDGIRPVRIATINTLDVEPLGNGLGDLFRPLLGQLDDVRCSLLNTITLAGANMFAKQKSLTEEDMEFVIRQFGILNLENPDLRSVGPNPQTVNELAGYEGSLVQQFRQGSGATDTLQALVSGEQATATSTSLAMNEAVRNLSVQSEVIAPTLCKDHIKVILQNAQKYNTQPFVLTINNAPITVMPSDLLVDIDVRVKTVTDQDFRPAKIQRLREGIQLMLGAGPNAIPGYKMNAGPALLEYMKMLDVPDFEKSVAPLTEQDLLQMRLMAEMQAAPVEAEGSEADEGEDAQEARARGERPGRMEQRKMNREMGMPMAETMKTPVGAVLTAPGDVSTSTQAIRNASMTKETE